MVYDTHAHLDDAKLYNDLPQVISRAVEAGVTRINTIGCDWKSSLMSVHIAEKFPDYVWAAVGVHPHEAKDMDDECLEKLIELAKADKVIAWGEIGLDYFRNHSPRDDQRRAFRQQIHAARAAKLPIVIHDRDAHQEVYDMINEEKAGLHGGVMHCFSGSWEFAKQCMRQGFLLSFGGPLTYNNARVAVEVAAKAPPDMLMVETDCPYLSPVPHRGKTNEPSRVVLTLKRMAEIRNVDYDEMAAITTANACRLFGV